MTVNLETRTNRSRALPATSRATTRLSGLVACSVLCPALLCASSPIHAAEDTWTVATMARDGSWGVATAASQTLGIAAAIRACKAMAATQNDCGAYLTTTRGDWTLAKFCGGERILATGKTLEKAEQAALARQLDLSLFYVPALPPCRRVFTVDPHGTIAGSGFQYLGSR